MRVCARVYVLYMPRHEHDIYEIATITYTEDYARDPRVSSVLGAQFTKMAMTR